MPSPSGFPPGSTPVIRIMPRRRPAPHPEYNPTPETLGAFHRNLAAKTYDLVDFERHSRWLDDHPERLGQRMDTMNRMQQNELLLLMCSAFREGSLTSNVMEAAGLYVGICLVNPQFKDTFRKLKAQGYGAIAERLRDNPIPGTGILARRFAKRRDLCLARANGGRLPYTPETAAMQDIRLCAEYYETQRDATLTDAQKQAYRERFQTARNRLHTMCMADGLTDKELVEAQHRVIANVRNGEMQLLAKGFARTGATGKTAWSLAASAGNWAFMFDTPPDTRWEWVTDRQPDLDAAGNIKTDADGKTVWRDCPRFTGRLIDKDGQPVEWNMCEPRESYSDSVKNTPGANSYYQHVKTIARDIAMGHDPMLSGMIAPERDDTFTTHIQACSIQAVQDGIDPTKVDQFNTLAMHDGYMEAVCDTLAKDYGPAAPLIARTALEMARERVHTTASDPQIAARTPQVAAAISKLCADNGIPAPAVTSMLVEDLNLAASRMAESIRDLNAMGCSTSIAGSHLDITVQQHWRDLAASPDTRDPRLIRQAATMTGPAQAIAKAWCAPAGPNAPQSPWQYTPAAGDRTNTAASPMWEDKTRRPAPAAEPSADMEYA